MEQESIISQTSIEGNWLPLTEYAVKSGVSLSTIRRKIKSNTIAFRLEKGRYLIYWDETQPTPTSFSLEKPVAQVGIPVPPKMVVPVIETQALEHSPFKSAQPTSEFSSVDQAVKLISDAFEHTLREKDERIRLLEKRNEELEDRLNELRTLVRVLEEKFEVRY